MKDLTRRDFLAGMFATAVIASLPWTVKDVAVASPTVKSIWTKVADLTDDEFFTMVTPFIHVDTRPEPTRFTMDRTVYLDTYEYDGRSAKHNEVVVQTCIKMRDAENPIVLNRQAIVEAKSLRGYFKDCKVMVAAKDYRYPHGEKVLVYKRTTT